MVVELSPAGQEFLLTVLLLLLMIDGVANIALGLANAERPTHFGAGSVVWGVVILVIGVAALLK